MHVLRASSQRNHNRSRGIEREKSVTHLLFFAALHVVELPSLLETAESPRVSVSVCLPIPSIHLSVEVTRSVYPVLFLPLSKY